MTKITEKVLKKNPESVRKYARGEKKVLTLCYLAGMVNMPLSFMSAQFEYDRFSHMLRS